MQRYTDRERYKRVISTQMDTRTHQVWQHKASVEVEEVAFLVIMDALNKKAFFFIGFTSHHAFSTSLHTSNVTELLYKKRTHITERDTAERHRNHHVRLRLNVQSTFLFLLMKLITGPYHMPPLISVGQSNRRKSQVSGWGETETKTKTISLASSEISPGKAMHRA